MKKSVSVLIAFFCSFSCALIFSNVLRAEDNENLIEIAPYSDGVMILKSKGDVSGTLVIPEQIAGKPVRCIGEKAFQSNKLLTEVVLPGGLKTIRNNAFEFCQSLTTVEFPESLQTIGEDAFAFCESLENVKFPQGLRYIGKGAFYGCKSIKSVEFQKGLTSVGELAFSDCESLRDAIFPEGFQTIEKGAFRNCKLLSTVEFSESLKEIKDEAFSDCRSLTYMELPNGLQKIGANAFTDCASITKVTVPDGVQTVEDGVFKGCESLKNVKFPESLQIIGNEAFKECKSLAFVTFPKGLRKIGKDAFDKCLALKIVVLPDNLSELGDGAFSFCKSLITVKLPNGLEVIEGSSFFCCESLISVKIPASVKRIGVRAFGSCESLVNVEFSEGLTTVDESAFALCSSLASVYLPDSLELVRDRAFYGCESIKSVDFPDGLRAIGEAAFHECNNLKKVEIPSGLPTIAAQAFPKGIKVTVRQGTRPPRSETNVELTVNEASPEQPEEEPQAGAALEITINGATYVFRYSPAGTFTMGSPEKEKNRKQDERQHEVTITRGFWILETPVTQAFWKSVADGNRSSFFGDFRPVEHVNWHDCQQFVAKLNEGGFAPAGYRFSLPTEAEWEYACRAGTKGPYSFGNSLNGSRANCTTAPRTFLDKGTSPFKLFPSNLWGLYDMHGNVWEWCEDTYGESPDGPATDPCAVQTEGPKVLRGGCWGNPASQCRSASRHKDVQTRRTNGIGFRLVLRPIAPESSRNEVEPKRENGAKD